MCFASKTKIPKPEPQQLKAPEPMLLEPPKGVEVGDGADDNVDNVDTTKGRDSLTVEKKTGEGTQTTKVTDTGAAPATTAKTKKSSSAVSKALKR